MNNVSWWSKLFGKFIFNFKGHVYWKFNKWKCENIKEINICSTKYEDLGLTIFILFLFPISFEEYE